MDSPARILFTIPNFITAGSGRAMLNIIQRLDRSRFAPAVCVSRKGGNLDREVERMGIPFIEAPFTVSPRPYHTLLFRAWKASRVFSPYKFSLWHSFHYADDYTEPLIARFAGAKKWIYTKKNMGWGSRAWKLRSKFSSMIAVQNTAMVGTFFNGNARKIRYIPRGVDTQHFSRNGSDGGLRKELCGSDDKVLVAHVAHFVSVKNHPHLIRALAKTKRNIDLVLVGDFLDSMYVEEVKLLVDQLGLRDRVHFPGNIADIPELMHSVDIFAFCSHREACPVAMLEAMACGLPCVTTAIPAMRDIHVDGETGLVVPVNDVDAFAGALDELAGNPELRRQMGSDARKRIERLFTIEREVKDHEEMYSEMLI